MVTEAACREHDLLNGSLAEMRLVARVCMTLLLLQVCQNPRWRATGCTAARYPISHEADGPSSIAGWADHHLNHYQLAGSIKMKEREGRLPVMP